MKFHLIFTLVFCLSFLALKAGNNDTYVDNKNMLYQDKVYKPNIHTARIFFKGWETGYPAIRLNSDEKISFGFDDFETEFKTYTYTIIHCDANWEPTNITPSDYIDGYHEDQISSIAHSFNTIQFYTHYSLVFPTEVLKITKSGNYLLKVYENYNAEDIVITKRFMVYEELVDVAPNIHAATYNEDRFNKQEVDFKIFSGGYTIADPMRDLKVVIQQNDRDDNAVRGLTPVFIKDNELVYDEDQKNVFNGGKEFKYFNIQSLRNPDIRINKIRRDSAGFTQIFLNTDDKRAFKRYTYEKDLNGKYTITTTFGNEPDTDADYCYVNFFWASETPVPGGAVYIFGQLSDWQCKKEFRMNYDEAFRGYIGKVFLKQGFYNYEYVLLNDKTNVVDETLTEGNRFETENDYTITVYHQPIGVFYDKLIAYKKIKFNTSGK